MWARVVDIIIIRGLFAREIVSPKGMCCFRAVLYERLVVLKAFWYFGILPNPSPVVAAVKNITKCS